MSARVAWSSGGGVTLGWMGVVCGGVQYRCGGQSIVWVIIHVLEGLYHEG